MIFYNFIVYMPRYTFNRYNFGTGYGSGALDPENRSGSVKIRTGSGSGSRALWLTQNV